MVNARSALQLGHVRGVALLAAACQGLPVAEYAPLTIKSSVVGYGLAKKEQVQYMVARLLNLEHTPGACGRRRRIGDCHLPSAHGSDPVRATEIHSESHRREATVNRFRRFAGLGLPGIVLSSLLSASPAMPGSVLAAAADDSADQAAGQIQFTYENPSLQPAKYVLIFQENGSGHYSSEPGTAPLGDAQAWPIRPQDRPIAISGRTRDALFSAARQAKYFAGSCGDVGTKVAFQGKKTLQYQGNGWAGKLHIQLEQ